MIAQEEMKSLMDKMIWRGGVHLVAHRVCCMPQSLGGFKKMDVTTQLQARRASWGVRYLDPECPGRWVGIVTEWLREGGLGPGVWTQGPSRGNRRALANSRLPKFWKDCIQAMWQVKPRRIVGTDPNMHSVHTHDIETVTIEGYCTVQYNKTQRVPLANMTVKLAYWAIIRHSWGNPVPRGQTNWVARGMRAEWPRAWSNIRSDTISKKQAERAYKLMHCVGGSSNRLCSVEDCGCGHPRANMWHGIFECREARRAWGVVEQWWQYFVLP